MKNYFNKITMIFCSILFFAACKKTQTDITYSGGGTAPALSASSDTIALIPEDSSNTGLALSWTNPNYTFSNGESSLNVNYSVQIDTAGSDFNNPSDVIETVPSDLNASFTIAKLNSFLGNTLLLQNGVSHNIVVRVTSFLNQSSLPLYSNILAYTVTPYAPPPKVTPPSTGTLYIVGDATPGGWPPLSNDPSTEQFTQISNTEYQLTISLNSTGGYKFVAIPGQWNEQWSVATTHDPNELLGGSFILNGNDCAPPSASGTYLIDVNFQTGTFTLMHQ